MKRYIILISFITSLIIYSCGGDGNSKLHVDVSKINIKDIKVKRYGKDLFAVDPDNIKQGLDALSVEYYFFLGGNLDDTLNLIQIKSYITDPYLIEIYSASINKYPELQELNESLTAAFRHLKYYFPEQQIPTVYTYISGLEYEHPVRLIDTVMIIALDMYLGKDAKFYKQIGLPLYKTNYLTGDYITPDCMKEIAKDKVSFDVSNKTLLEQIIYNGKLLYIIDAMVPYLPDEKKIKYTIDQLKWCQLNEANVWSFFIDQQLLYSKDLTEISKFLNDGPFTTGLSKESPPRTGHWIGWQIVRAYMNNNDLSLTDLIHQNDAQKILAESSYKPGK